MQQLYFEVALPVPINKTFTYSYNSDENKNYCGCRVIVPFGRGRMFQELSGVIVKQSLELPHNLSENKIKSIIDLIDPTPVFSEKMLKFLIWISTYYLSPIGETFKAALPSGISPRKIYTFLINPEKPISSFNNLSPLKRKILDFIAENNSAVTLEQIELFCEIKNANNHINYLLTNDFLILKHQVEHKVKVKYQKVISISEKLLENKEELKTTLSKLDKKAIRQSQVLSYLIVQHNKQSDEIPLSEISKLFAGASAATRALIEKGILIVKEREIDRSRTFSDEDKLASRNESLLSLTDEQSICLEKINEKLNKSVFSSFLLHGITGSGKTLVYIHAIKKALSQNKTVLLLVPEISLTPQLIDRFELVFPNLITVFHSKMSDGERYDSWRSVLSGMSKIVLGTRSALFSPLPNLGLIIVDEEHDSSYKQDAHIPFYNARDAAIYRAKLEDAVIVLGSATPSIESYYNTEIGKLQLLEIKERADNAILPKIELIDMLSAKKNGQIIHGFSRFLIDKIKEKLHRKEGIILFQNKRGYSNFLECSDCGYIPQCKHCNISLTYHRTTNDLRCHYCGYVQKTSNVCEVCGKVELNRIGIGTQRAESDLLSILENEDVNAKIARLDLDTTSKKGSHRKILQSFSKGETDILLGTQIVAKGLDFDRVTLVGVINADIQLYLPDFRSSERTFQLLSQVAGRAGRSGDLRGEVLIQTYNMANYAIENAAKSNFHNFYKIELENRKNSIFPPFVRYCLIEFSSKDENKVMSAANTLYKSLHKHKSLIIYPPSPAPISKLNNYFRWQIAIKSIKSLDSSGKTLRQVLNLAFNEYNKTATSAVKTKVDIDSFSGF